MLSLGYLVRTFHCVNNSELEIEKQLVWCHKRKLYR